MKFAYPLTETRTSNAAAISHWCHRTTRTYPEVATAVVCAATRGESMGTPRIAVGLRRDLEILDALRSPEATRGSGLSVTRIAELTCREKSQVSRALAGMREEGLVDRDPDTLTYRCGWRLFALAAATGESRLVHTASPYLKRLVSQVHETAYLCVLRGRNVMTLLAEASPNAFRSLGWEGLTVSVADSSAGRALISDWDEDAIRDFFIDDLPHGQAMTRHAQKLDMLVDEARQIRTMGYSKVDWDLEEGLVGVSAPVRDFRGLITAAVNVVAPRTRLQSKLDAAGRLTNRCATQLSRALGFEGSVIETSADDASDHVGS